MATTRQLYKQARHGLKDNCGQGYPGFKTWLAAERFKTPEVQE